MIAPFMDAATPSLAESAVYGLAFQKHDSGFQSGGLLGYSTFFTGYRAGDGALRAMSLGRLGLSGASAAASALNNVPAIQRSWLGRHLPAMTKLNEYGVAGVVNSLSTDEYKSQILDPVRNRIKDTHIAARNYGYSQAAKHARLNSALYATDATYRQHSRQYLQRHYGGKVEEFARRSATTAGENAMRTAIAGTNSGKWKMLAGALGGAGFDSEGKNNSIFEYDADTNRHYRKAAKGSTGASFAGKAGSILGKAVRVGALLEIGMIASDLLIDAAGSSYGSMVRVTNRMQERLNGSGMSSAYFNQASSTERMRAMRDMNTSVLNPRNQLMGNESYFTHR